MSRTSLPILPAVALAALATAGCSTSTANQAEPPAAPQAVVPEGSRPNQLYSPAMRVGDMLFLSGQIGTRGPDGPIDDVGGQTGQVLENVRSVVEAAGLGMEDVVKCTVFLADIEDYGAMNEVYRTVWPGSPPARTAVAVSGLPAGALVEIECFAWAGG